MDQAYNKFHNSDYEDEGFDSTADNPFPDQPRYIRKAVRSVPKIFFLITLFIVGRNLEAFIIPLIWFKDHLADIPVWVQQNIPNVNTTKFERFSNYYLIVTAVIPTLMVIIGFTQGRKKRFIILLYVHIWFTITCMVQVLFSATIADYSPGLGTSIAGMCYGFYFLYASKTGRLFQQDGSIKHAIFATLTFPLAMFAYLEATKMLFSMIAYNYVN